MRPITAVPSEPAKEQQAAPAASRCPVCSGPLIELRGFVRCTRCHFALCASCEGESWRATPEQ